MVSPYCKNYDAKTSDIDEDKSTEVSVITTSSVDRDLEVVVSKGLTFPDHVTVLFNHDPDKPVGRKMWTKTHGGVVKAKTEYGDTPFAQEIFSLVTSGVLLQKSIGMDPATMKRRQIVPEDLRKHVEWKGAETIIEGAEVLEYSVVSIAAQPEAVRLAKSKGMIRLTEAEFPCLKTEAPRITRVSMATVKRAATAPVVKLHRMGNTELVAVIDEQWKVYRGVL
jgi:phage head maturation protease